MSKPLHPFQEQAIEAALARAPYRRVFAFETGLGKSRTAIECIKRTGAKRTLIVCPALVRTNWVSELDKWWEDHPPVGVINVTKERVKGLSKAKLVDRDEAYMADIQIVSYSLVDQVDLPGYDCVLLDEAHLLKSPSSKWSQACLNIVKANPSAAVFGLSATLAPNQPTDIFGPLNTIWPGRWGSLDRNGKRSFKFCYRYAIAEQSKYGWKFYGVNPAYLDELKERLDTCVSRATKREYAHLLPAFDLKVLSVPGTDTAASSLSDFLFGTNHQSQIELALLKSTREKYKHVKTWVKETSAENICILTHLRDTARLIADDVKGICVTGDIPPDQRHVLINEAKNRKLPLVATMHSVGIGIDLTAFTDVLFAELYWRPETIIQALGRFSRLSSTMPASCSLLVLEGTIEEMIAYNLLRKIDAINSLIDAGQGEASLAAALSGGSDEEVLQSLFETVSNYVGGED